MKCHPNMAASLPRSHRDLTHPARQRLGQLKTRARKGVGLGFMLLQSVRLHRAERAFRT